MAQDADKVNDSDKQPVGKTGQDFAAALTGGAMPQATDPVAAAAGTEGDTAAAVVNPAMPPSTTATTGVSTSQPITSPDATTPERPERKAEPESQPEFKGFDALPDETKAEIRKLRRENAERRKRLQDLEERDLSEKQRAERLAAREKQRAEEAEAKLLRYEIATAKQVPPEAVSLLTATSREELEAQADGILKLAKKAQESATNFDGGARSTAEGGGDPSLDHNEWLAKALRGQQP